MEPKPRLKEHLYAAYEWISAAREWDEAKQSPAEYASAAAANATKNGEHDVYESDLLEVIEWFFRNSPCV